MKTFILIGFSLVFSASCSLWEKKEKKTEIYDVQVYRDQKDPEKWNVVYKFPQNLEAFRFFRDTNNFRHEKFQILTPGIVFDQVDGAEILRRESGGEFSHIHLQFPSLYGYLPKDYEFFKDFSGHDVLLYTGHLTGEGYSAYSSQDKILAKRIPLKARFFFQPRKKEIISILGNVFRNERAVYIDEYGEGTYVYLGSAESVETKDLVLVADPFVPPWIRKEVRMALPQIFTYLGKKLGQQLPKRPTVFLNWQNPLEGGASYSGGTLTDLVQLSISGKKWTRPSKELKEKLFRFMVHESAHLWNSQFVSYEDGKHAWMHEGSADALSFRALLKFNIISEERFWELHNGSLNKCLMGLSNGGALVDSGKARRFKNYYDCGATLGLITEALDKDHDLFSFWRELLAKGVKEGGYSDVLYFKVLQDRGANDKQVEDFKELVFKDLSNPGKKYREFLTSLGFEARSLSLSPKDTGLKNILGKRLAGRILKEYCALPINSFFSEGILTLHPNEKCPDLPKNFKATKVFNLSFIKEPSLIWQRFVKTCFHKRRVFFETAEGEKWAYQCLGSPRDFSFFNIWKHHKIYKAADAIY